MPTRHILSARILLGKMKLKPLDGYVIVELLEDYELIKSPDKQYATHVKGRVVATGGEGEDYLLNKRVWFNGYKDDMQEDIDGVKYAAIDINEIGMYEDVED